MDPGLVPLSLGGFCHPGVVSGMEPPTSAALLDDLSVLPFPYPGSPRGDFPFVSTLPTIQAFRCPPIGTPTRYAASVSPFSFALVGPGLGCVGPVGLFSGSASLSLYRFLLYKHRLSINYTHSFIFHVKYGRHFPFALIPLGHFYPRLIMPGPMRRTPSYKASDFLKTEYC